jgi:hypothetical protein
VSPQVLDKPQAEDRLLCGMMQDVQPDQARVEILIPAILALVFFNLLHFVIEIRYRIIADFCQERRKSRLIDGEFFGSPAT